MSRALRLATGLAPLAALLLGFVLASVASAAPVPLIRIGLITGANDVRVSSDAAWYLGLVGSGLRPSLAEAKAEWVLEATERGLRVLDSAGRLRGETSDTLFAVPTDAESSPLRVNGKSYRGQLLLWGRGGRVSAVNVVDLESYLCGVVPLELGPQPDNQQEALLAQAVAARSYTLATMGRWKARGFDLLASVEDQVYGGVESERAGCTQAVEDTRGVVALFESRPIRAYYCSTCGGHTCGVHEAWGDEVVPYLRGVNDKTHRVDDAFCSRSPRFRWTETWTVGELEPILDRSLPKVRSDWRRSRAGRLVSVELKDRRDSDQAAVLRLQFQHGTVDLRGDEIRWVVRRPGGDGLRSAFIRKVSLQKTKGHLSRVTLEGQGYGHGVGLCQFGAMGMAAAGYTHDQIIEFYYRGVRLERCY